MLLSDIKVLDLSGLLPGPLCSLMLADLGADVIKIESLSGDSMRYADSGRKKSAYFAAVNRNKKSIAINLKAEEGIKIFMKLAKNSDVIIEGFRPGKANNLGIGYDKIKKLNPKIVYCSISGYGQKGSNKNTAGHDLNYISLSGLLGEITTKPFVPGIQIADASSAFIAAFSIVSALLYRQRKNKGNYIDVSAFQSSLSVMGIHIAQKSVSKNKNKILSGSKPCYNVYKTKDGRYMSLGAIENKFWKSFCTAAERKDLISKQLNEDKKTMEEIKEVFKKKTMKEWVLLNKKYDFCCGPVKNMDEVLNDTELNSRKILIDLEGTKQVAMPASFSTVKKIRYSKSPELGEDTDKLLLELGYDKQSIISLRTRGIILQPKSS